LNEEIKTEEEYQSRLQSLEDTYRELLDDVEAEEDYIEKMKEIRSDYSANVNTYYDNLIEMLN
jgi:L-lysine 2,3-aminomutase